MKDENLNNENDNNNNNNDNNINIINNYINNINIHDDFEMIENSDMNLNLKKTIFSKNYDWSNYGYSIIIGSFNISRQLGLFSGSICNNFFMIKSNSFE